MFNVMQPQTKELSMRGDRREEDELFSYVALEDRVPAKHPLRVIRSFVDPILAELSPRFDAIYAKRGRPSIPPEQLLRALLLKVLYTVRSERMLCEQLQYNLLFRWFVGLGMDGEVWVPSTRTETILFQPDVEVNTVHSDVDEITIAQVAGPEALVLLHPDR